MYETPVIPANDTLNWRRTEQWLGFGLSALFSTIGMVGIVTLGAYVSTAVRSTAPAYVFFAAGMGFLASTLSVRGVEFHKMPVRIGYDTTAIFLEFRRKPVKKLRYEQLARLSLLQYASGWYLELETSEGEEVTAGADRTDQYGRGLLESFAHFQGSSGRWKALVVAEKGFYPSRRLSVSLQRA